MSTVVRDTIDLLKLSTKIKIINFARFHVEIFPEALLNIEF